MEFMKTIGSTVLDSGNGLVKPPLTCSPDASLALSMSLLVIVTTIWHQPWIIKLEDKGAGSVDTS